MRIIRRARGKFNLNYRLNYADSYRGRGIGCDFFIGKRACVCIVSDTVFTN